MDLRGHVIMQKWKQGTGFAKVTRNCDIWEKKDYEIKSGSSQEEICGIISSICIDLKREDDFVNVRYENGEYIIINNGITIGRAVINDKATTDLLKIYFCN